MGITLILWQNNMIYSSSQVISGLLIVTLPVLQCNPQMPEAIVFFQPKKLNQCY